MKTFRSMGLRHQNGKLLLLDQQLLPREEKWLEIRDPDQMIAAIRALKVRGAPLIGVAAAAALAKFAENGAGANAVREAGRALREARPTAVNLMTAMDRMLAEFDRGGNLSETAERIFDEDVLLCERMSENGAALIEDGDGILTHCNTGGLATAGIGTALGAIRKAHETGKRVHVFVDETRPLLQGARLTCWELKKLEIPHTLICDNMAAALMRAGRVRKIFVGADRIAANGDFANKVGTYGVAVLARHHGIAFHPVAPRTTVDLACPTGDDIPIEQRQAVEVSGDAAPAGVSAWNPAFDVTPAALVSALVLDSGVYGVEELAGGALRKAMQENT